MFNFCNFLTLTSQRQRRRVSRISTRPFSQVPTFVDIGYSFGGAIIAEDLMLHQLWEAKNVTTCLASSVAQEQGVDGAVPPPSS
ncbi:hypothetical protein BC826DRAFT_1067166 [Russula brevipes]|nr:hypothetical protein BC826DRAFT_1067166 [Russula brevipes]